MERKYAAYVMEHDFYMTTKGELDTASLSGLIEQTKDNLKEEQVRFFHLNSVRDIHDDFEILSLDGERKVTTLYHYFIERGLRLEVI